MYERIKTHQSQHTAHTVYRTLLHEKIDDYKLNLSLSLSASSSFSSSFLFSRRLNHFLLFAVVRLAQQLFAIGRQHTNCNGKKDNTQIRVNCNKIPVLSLSRCDNEKKSPLTFIIALSEYRKTDTRHAYIFVRSAQRLNDNGGNKVR